MNRWVMAFISGLLASLRFGVLLLPIAAGAAGKPRAEPQLLSLFPLGAARDTRTNVELRGQALDGAYAVWFDCTSIHGTIKSVEETKSDKKETSTNSPAVQRAALELSVSPNASLGTHFIRIVSSRGVSNPLAFSVYQEPVAVETQLPMDQAPVARRLLALPVVVSGKIGEAGEVDYYSFEAQSEQEVFFEVLHSGRLDPQLTLLEPSGSWFDARALTQLAFSDETNLASKDLSPTLSYRFSRKGRFLIAVSAFLGRGNADGSYQLRIVFAPKGEVTTARRAAHETEERWQERAFARVLGQDRLKRLGARTVSVPEGEGLPVMPKSSSLGGGSGLEEKVSKPHDLEKPPEASMTLFTEQEAERETQDAPEIPVPLLIEGTINQPGDIDRFRFRVKDGARLAFEIETPAKPAPFLTPRLGVFDTTGQEVLNNVFAFVQGSGEFIEKVIEPKVTYKFERGGEYVLEIRDLISRNGGADFRYRVVVRPQIPHVGRVETASSFGRTFDGSITKGPELQQLNLTQGMVKKVTILTEQEEGFDGQVAISIEGLPPGVQVFPATEVESERARPLDEGKKERFRPGQQLATILLSMASDAPVTRLPVNIQLKARPVVNGKFGPGLPLQMIPVMVVPSGESAMP